MKTSAHQYALLLLAQRDHTRQELIQKLRAKGYETDEINATIVRFTETNLINEPRFIENYIHWRQKKGLGPERIRMELKKRGIADEMIAEQLDITDNAWLTEIRNIWLKHFRGKIPEDFKQRAKQIRFFYYRGFTQEQIDSILKDTYGNDEQSI